MRINSDTVINLVEWANSKMISFQLPGIFILSASSESWHENSIQGMQCLHLCRTIAELSREHSPNLFQWHPRYLMGAVYGSFPPTHRMISMGAAGRGRRRRRATCPASTVACWFQWWNDGNRDGKAKHMACLVFIIILVAFWILNTSKLIITYSIF